VDEEHPRLVHLAPALVGSPHSRPGTATLRDIVVRRERSGAARTARQRCARTRTSSTRGSRRALAVLDAGLAGADATISRRFYPTPLLITGFDIIFFWVPA
jgi:hypothetical protein